MKQHYLSQMYLKGWKTTVNKQENQICVYTPNKTPRFFSIKKIGYKEDFYSFIDETGELNHSVENWLSKLEANTEPILQKVGRGEPLTSNEKKTLARFIFVLWQRVPFYKDNLFNQIHTGMLEHGKGERIMRVLEKYGFDVNLIKQSYLSDEFAKFSYSIQLERDSFGYSQRIAQDMKWTFLKASSSKEFITSDNPIVQNERGGIGHPLYGHIVFPINKNIILLITNISTPFDNYEVLSDERTDRFNNQIIKQAYNLVFASLKDMELQKLVDKDINSNMPIIISK